MIANQAASDAGPQSISLSHGDGDSSRYCFGKLSMSIVLDRP